MLRVLHSLEREQKRSTTWPELRVSIFDDASEANYTEVWACAEKLFGPGCVHRSSFRHGKHQFWKLWSELLQDCRDSPPADYYIFLQDDNLLCGSFFEMIVRFYREIENHDLSLTALNLRTEPRVKEPVWTRTSPTKEMILGHSFWKTGWVDCTFVANARLLKALNYDIAQISPHRWRRDPTLSSGVGRQISQRMVTAGLSAWCPARSMTLHLNETSLLNPESRAIYPLEGEDFYGEHYHFKGDEPCESIIGKNIIASMATIPGRIESLPMVLDSILPQVDRLYVYLDGHTEIPLCLSEHDKIQVVGRNIDRRLGDAGKFLGPLEMEHNDFYCFTIDDDVLYPPDYVRHMLSAIHRYDRKAVITAHGSVLQSEKPITHYFRQRKLYHYRMRVVSDVAVHVPGTGAMAFHSSTIRAPIQAFEQANMADVWFAGLARRQCVPIIVCAHEKGWIRDAPSNSPSLYEQFQDKSSIQSSVLNSFGWPPHQEIEELR